jgi:hypothetical protein
VLPKSSGISFQAASCLEKLLFCLGRIVWVAAGKQASRRSVDRLEVMRMHALALIDKSTHHKKQTAEAKKHHT